MARKRATKGAYKRAEEEKKKRTAGGKYDLGDGDHEYFSPKKGNMSLVVVPYEVALKNHPDRIPVGDIWCRMPVKIHYSVGVEEQAVICPKTVGKRCPICEDRVEKLKCARTDEEKDAAWAMKAQDRELYNVVDLDDLDSGVQFWDVALGNFGNLFSEEIDAGQEEYDLFYDPDEPYSVEVRFKQDSFGGNKFLKAAKIDFEETEAMEDDWLDDAIPLDQSLVILDYAELLALHLGLDDEEDEENEPEEKPKRTRGRRSSKKEEKEDEPVPDEDEEDEENEPEEKPKRGHSRRGRSSNKDKDKKPSSNKDKDKKPSSRRAVAKKDEEKEPEEPEEQEPEKQPKRGAGRRGKKKEEAASGACPGGGTFATDFDTLDECETCDKWNDCADAYDAANG